MQNRKQQEFIPPLSISGNILIGKKDGGGKTGILIDGNSDVSVSDNYIEHSDTAIELKNCNGRIDVKKNKAKRVKKFVVIKDIESDPQKTLKIKNHQKYEFQFNKKILELLNLEAQAKFLKNYEDLKKIRFLKAHLKIKI